MLCKTVGIGINAYHKPAQRAKVAHIGDQSCAYKKKDCANRIVGAKRFFAVQKKSPLKWALMSVLLEKYHIVSSTGGEIQDLYGLK